MKTITTTTTVFESLKELFEASKGHQLTAQEIVNGRSYINGNWQDFEMTSEARDEAARVISETLGGWKATQQAVYNSLRWGRPQHWGLSRVFFREYEGKILCSYCAGQDYPSELRAIRNALK
jgi:hypothetical protein